MSSHRYRRIMGPEPASWAYPVRAVLGVGEFIYARVIAARNARYDKRGPSHRLPIPVISVGNVTAGGTGKTPVVVDLVHRVRELGMTPAVVARGYGAGPGGANDEERLVRRRCRDVAYVADADRARGARGALSRFEPDVIILDDAFQHRRLARDLDIVLVDATCPFGYGHLLPRGLLREPPQALGRAQVIAMTRADQVSADALKRLDSDVARLAPDANRFSCRHAPAQPTDLDGAAVEEPLTGKRAALISAIANPDAFVMTVRGVGVEVVADHRFPDHHRYGAKDVARLRTELRSVPHDVVLTTEKDAVKLAELDGVADLGVLVLPVTIDFGAEGGKMLQRVLKRVLRSP